MNAIQRAGPALVALLLTGCGATSQGAATQVATVPAATIPAVTAAPPTSQTAAPAPTFSATCRAGAGEQWVLVESRANLFGAGRDSPPAPGGGGGGVLPPLIELPAGGSRLVTFPCTDGVTDPYGGTPSVGPAGYAGPPTDVESTGGISGIRSDDRVMFLAGVFISNEAPAEPAPERLEFSGEIDFKRLEPELAQTFYIGDGTGKTFVAPEGATRLSLGFIDAAGFVGEPGWYGNNFGALEATVKITVD